MSKHIAPTNIRCEAITVETWYKRGDDLRCPNIYSVVINGKKLCGRHGQKESLALMLQTGQAKIHPRVTQRFEGVEIVKQKGKKLKA